MHNERHIPEPLHGNVGIPAVWATIEDAILSPRDHMAFSGGPEKLNKWRIITHCRRNNNEVVKQL